MLCSNCYIVDLADCNPTPDGKRYTGKITLEHKTCVPWTSVNAYRDEQFADKSKAEAGNYCRNPNGFTDMTLFCMVEEVSNPGQYSRESCDAYVPLCG